MTSAEFQDRLSARAESTGVHVSAELAKRLESYYRLLATWNRRINLTALDLDSLPADDVDRLLIEPLAAARLARSGVSVLDVGSGGGSPAIPFALAMEASDLTMVESRSRKSVFLREAAYAVGLADARVLAARFEEVAQSEELMGRFDLVTIRAVRIADEDWARLRRVLTVGGSVFLLHQPGSACGQPAGFAIHGPHPLTDRAELTAFTNQP